MPRILAKLRSLPELRDVNSDQQDKGLAAEVTVDRDTASRLGITPAQVDAALYASFGQAQVSTMYRQLNQYHVVMEVDPNLLPGTDALRNTYVKSSTGVEVPLASFTKYQPSNTALQVNHQGFYPAVTLSFNLAPNVPLGNAAKVVETAMRDLGVPASVHGGFQGTAAAFKDSAQSQPLLILTALITVYIVLGMLYESVIHPITILSTLPSAGVGAILAIMLTGNDLNVIALIGIILLIGIVKKNAILMIDFAVNATRVEGKSPEDAIYQACSSALPSYYDDDHGGIAGRAAAGAGRRHRIRTAASAGHSDCGRADCEPGTDALYHACDLSLHGPHTPARGTVARRTSKASPTCAGNRRLKTISDPPFATDFRKAKLAANFAKNANQYRAGRLAISNRSIKHSFVKIASP